MKKVLFVCLGNICRSPMAQFVFQHMVNEKGLSDQFEIDSAGTERYNEIHHAGIYPETKEMLTRMHIPFTEHYSRQIRPKDYDNYDYILTMDESNIRNIMAINGPDTKHKIHRLLDFTSKPRDIRDPWYTGNFEETYWDVVEGADAFLTFVLNDEQSSV